MKKSLLFVLLFSAVLNVTAQQKKAGSTFYLVPQIALLSGQNATTKELLLSGGINLKEWCFGLGTALDGYEIKSLPVFIDISRNITHWHHPLFAYLNAGVNLPLAGDAQDRLIYYGWSGTSTKSNFDRGLYGDIGLGYALQNKKKHGLLLSAGYCVKTITEKFTQNIYNDFPPYVQVTSAERRLDYHFTRYIFKIGYRF